MTGKADGALGLLIARLFPRPTQAPRPYDPLEEVRNLTRTQEQPAQERPQGEGVKP